MKDLIPWQMAGVSVSLNKYCFFIGSAFLEIKKPNLFPTEKKKVPFFEAYLESHWKLQWLSSQRHICTDKLVNNY